MKSDELRTQQMDTDGKAQHHEAAYEDAIARQLRRCAELLHRSLSSTGWAESSLKGNVPISRPYEQRSLENEQHSNDFELSKHKKRSPDMSTIA